ncbi:MAG: hypothetical protein IJL69_07195, partial [Oscillospiraceae bacterium]|nr:hypothetical protein [Oscillospiraceae bacterium]
MVIDRIREKLGSFAQKLRERDDFLLLTHRRPDGDTVCSAAALCRALRAAGKTAYLAVNPEITARFAPYHGPLAAPAGFAPKTVVSVDISAPQQFESSQRV